VSHASAFAVSPDVDVVAVCDLKEELITQFLSNFSSTWPEVRTYTDHRKMLEDEDIDLLGVATSDHLHAQIVQDAVAAGVRGILCEKPLATTLADADRMIDACERHGVAMTVDYFRHYRPHWNGALREFGDGPLGAVRRIVASYGGPRSMLFRNGSHLIDVTCWYAGGEPEWAIGVLDDEHQDYGPRYAGDGGKNPALEPGGSGLVQFDNGVRAFINISKRTVTEFELDVFGEKGRLRINNQSAQVWQPMTDSLPITLTHRTLPVPMTLRADTPAAVADLVQAIETGRETASPPREARKTLAIILAMLQSQAAGNIPVRFPVEDA
jgi:predicted dehydrogenase